MKKKVFMELLVKELESEVEKFRTVSEAAHAAATAEDMKAEGKYDTRAIEAGYLAGAQARRLGDLEAALALYRQMPAKNFADDDAIELGALVGLECGEVHALYFLGPQAGGLKLVFEGRAVIVVTPRSPIGEKLVGREVGDAFTVRTAGASREYEVVSIS